MHRIILVLVLVKSSSIKLVYSKCFVFTYGVFVVRAVHYTFSALLFGLKSNNYNSQVPTCKVR